MATRLCLMTAPVVMSPGRSRSEPSETSSVVVEGSMVFATASKFWLLRNGRVWLRQRHNNLRGRTGRPSAVLQQWQAIASGIYIYAPEAVSPSVVAHVRRHAGAGCWVYVVSPLEVYLRAT